MGQTNHYELISLNLCDILMDHSQASDHPCWFQGILYLWIEGGASFPFYYVISSFHMELFSWVLGGNSRTHSGLNGMVISW